MTDSERMTTRRRTLQLVGAAPLLLQAGFARAARHPTVVPPAGLADIIGAQCHLARSETPYGNWARVRACLDHVGIRHIRTAAPQRDTIGIRIMSQAAEAGYFLTFTMRHGRPLADSLADLEAFARAHPGSIAGIEGPNEIDHVPVSFNGVTDSKAAAKTDPVAALAYQAALYDAVKQSAMLRSVPVIAFSDFVQDRQKADWSNTHIYPRKGTALSGRLPGMHARLDPVGRPIVITETGFNSLPTARPFPGTDEPTQASLFQDLVDHVRAAGVRRLFIYELIDAYPPTEAMDTHFGLFRHDYSPKPAAQVIRGALRGS